MSDEIVHGVDDLMKSLHQFTEGVQKNIMVGAIRAGCKPIVQAAKRNVPKRTRNLEKAIGAVKRKTKDKTEVLFSVTPRRGGKFNGFYGHQIEFGNVFMAAQPFMRPALEEADKCIEASKTYMAKRIPKEIEKAKK